MKKILLSLIVVATPCIAAPVTVSGAWFRALPANLPAGGYFTIHNGGKKDLAINGAASPACGSLMLHQSTNMGGMSGMDMVDKVPLPAGGGAKFAEGGYHLMCMNAKFKPGDTVPVTLALSDGSKLTASFAVRDARGK